MKQFWIAVAGSALLCLAAGAQTASTSGSANAGASVSPGQASAGANANQSVQAPGASAGANASGNAQASGEAKEKSGESKSTHESGSAHGKSNAGAAAGANGNASAMLSEGSVVNTELTKPVDCKKAKPGDEVTAKVTEDVKSNGHVVVHKGSKVVGHVTEVQARDKEHADSKLGIAFDKVVLKDGQEMAFNGVVQAIAPPAQVLANASANQGAGLDAPGGGGGGRMPSGGGHGPGGGGGLLGGATSTVGATAGAATSTVGSVGGNVGGTAGAATSGLSSRGTLTSASSGAIGLQGLNLSSATAGSAQGSLITSPTQNIKLDSGTQVLLRAAGSASAAGATR